MSALFATSCGPARPVTPHATMPGATPGAHSLLGADGRLPRTAVPSKYDLRLRIDPNASEFAGEETIDLQLTGADVLVLHGRELTMESAALRFQGAAVSLAVSTVGDEIHLKGAPSVPGAAQLTLRWHSNYSKGLEGLYVASGAVYSQFEPMDARRAFPSFDEPSFKATFEITLDVPKGVQAFSNAPLREVKSINETEERFAFKATKPISTYLVALAVGKFAVLEDDASGGIPVRVLVPSANPAAVDVAKLGRAAQVYAKKTLKTLEEYFDYSYPFEKLDLVAVPDFGAGAMENPGLVTFREELLLVDRSRSPRRQVRTMEATVAHELAHQWFGDLTTMDWWDDLWLNEGLATFLEGEVLDRIDPAFGGRDDRLLDVQRAMDLDVLAAARAVRQPVHSKSEAEEAFDPLTYDKGASVINMLGAWLGDDVLRDGLRRYVRERAFSNGSSADLFQALERSSGKPVIAVATPFVEHSGVPLVRYAAHGPAGSACAALPSVSIFAWHRGVTSPSTAGADWRVPVCDLGNSRCVLGMAQDVCAAAGAPIPYRHGGRGYYRWELEGANAYAAALSDGAVPADVLASAWAHVRRDGADLRVREELVPLLAKFARLADATLGGAPVDGRMARGMEEAETILHQMDEVLSDEEHVRYARFLESEFLPVLSHLAPSFSESDNRVLMRRSLQLFLADAGSASLRKDARAVVDAWLSGPSGTSPTPTPDALQGAIEIAAFSGDLALWEAYQARAKNASEAVLRTTLYRALGSFEDPKLLAKTLELAMSDTVRRQDMIYILRPLFRRRATRKFAREWVYANWSAVQRKMPPSAASRLTIVATGLCDAAERRRATEFLTKNLADAEGAKRPLEELLELGAECEAERGRSAAVFTRAFRSDARPTK